MLHSYFKQLYLIIVNQDLQEEEWMINCTKIPPSAQEANKTLEDIWL